MKLFLCVALVVLGCSHDKTNRLPAEAWGSADYASEGIHTDAVWRADDYATAAATLKRIAADHPDRLPRFHGAKSGVLFAQLVSGLPDDPSATIEQRFVAHATLSGALRDLLKLYMPNPYDAASREVVELTGAELRESAVLASTSEAFLATFAPDDPSRPARVDGEVKMRSGYSLMLLGAVMMAGDQRISEDDRLALLDHIAGVLPTLFPHVNPDTQQQVRDLLGKYADRMEGRLRTAAVAATRALPN